MGLQVSPREQISQWKSTHKKKQNKINTKKKKKIYAWLVYIKTML